MNKIDKIAEHLSHPGHLPLSSRLFQPVLPWLVFSSTATFAVIGMNFYDPIVSTGELVVPFGQTGNSVRYAMTMAIIALIVSALGLACYNSFSRMFWFAVVAFGICATFSHLVVSGSVMLTILMSIVFMWLGLSTQPRTPNNSEKILIRLRVGIITLGLFLASGRHLFSYADWLYEYRLGEYSLLGLKDATVSLIYGVILLTSVLQAWASSAWDEWYKPPHSEKGWACRYKLIEYANKPSDTVFPGGSFLGGNIAGLRAAGLSFLKLTAWVGALLLLILLIAWGGTIWLLALLWRAIRVNFNLDFWNSLREALKPLLGCVITVTCAFYFSDQISDYPVENRSVQIGIWLGIAWLAISLLIWLLFPHQSDSDSNLGQILPRFAMASAWIFLIIGVGVCTGQLIKHETVDRLGVTLFLIPLSLMAVSAAIYSKAVVRSNSPEPEARPETNPKADGWWAIAPIVLFIVSVFPLSMVHWSIVLGVLLIVAAVALGFAFGYRCFYPVWVMAICLVVFGVIAPDDLLREIRSNKSNGRNIDYMLGIQAARAELEKSGYRLPK